MGRLHAQIPGLEPAIAALNTLLSVNGGSIEWGYARASTVEQLTESQREQIAQAGYEIEPKRFVEEKISGSAPAAQSPDFQKLFDHMESGDTLVVTKLDRIRRDSVDVQQTLRHFAARGVRLLVLQLGNLDLTSSAGELMIKVLAAIADFERDLIVERTQAGQARPRAGGKHKGRPASTSSEQREVVRRRLEAGDTVTAVAKDFNVSRVTIISIRDTSKRGTNLRCHPAPEGACSPGFTSACAITLLQL